jgi:transposase
MIFSKNTNKGVAYTKMAKWFNTISATFYSHYPEILNFFDNRNTNASTESFNAKLKAFRASLRCVAEIEFFLYRVAKIYA